LLVLRLYQSYNVTGTEPCVVTVTLQVHLEQIPVIDPVCVVVTVALQVHLVQIPVIDPVCVL